MANLRTAMDAAFWDLDIGTPQSLNGVARSIPGDPIPLDISRAGRALRVQQLSLLGTGFPLGIIPTWSPAPQRELGSFALHSCFLKAAFSNWWLGMIGQFRPKKLLSSLLKEFSSRDEWELPAFKDVARHFVDGSLYSIAMCTQLALTPDCSVFFSTEKQGERKGRRSKAMLYHKLPDHDIMLEAAWPELFIDNKGKYWEVPESISLNCLSLVTDTGLRYRFGIHKNGGFPKTVDSPISEVVPHSLQPGLCAKAVFSYEKSKDFWRVKEKPEDNIEDTPKGKFWRPSYDVRLKEPHAAISGILGATSESWLHRGKTALITESEEVNDGSIHLEEAKRRSRFNVDLFGSANFTLQHGSFRTYFNDLTRLDARLDVASASAIGKRIANKFLEASNRFAVDTRSSPRLNLIFQQQIVGPMVFRVDTRFLLDPTPGKRGPQLEDVIFSWNYSMRLLQSGKFMAWYSPKRKEGMVELRLFEF